MPAIAPEEILNLPLWEGGFEEGFEEGVEVVVGGKRVVEEADVRVSMEELEVDVTDVAGGRDEKSNEAALGIAVAAPLITREQMEAISPAWSPADRHAASSANWFAISACSIAWLLY